MAMEITFNILPLYYKAAMRIGTLRFWCAGEVIPLYRGTGRTTAARNVIDSMILNMVSDQAESLFKSTGMNWVSILRMHNRAAMAEVPGDVKDLLKRNHNHYKLRLPNLCIVWHKALHCFSLLLSGPFLFQSSFFFVNTLFFPPQYYQFFFKAEFQKAAVLRNNQNII